MNKTSAFRFWAPAVLLGAAAFAPLASTASGQNQQAATQAVLDKAHALEVRGRMDLATQFWQQVLLADPNNTEALGGLARAAKMGGNMALSNNYVERLRAINPNDPGIARVEQVGAQTDHNAQLQQAGKLAQQGQYAQSMGVYRQVYGDQPPPGDQALAYYETESATEDGRPHAVAGLRGLVQKFPSDTRYQVALGRILTYNPKTRPEGRKLLAAHPNDPQAVEALRQSLLWDAQNPATSGDIRAYLARHQDAQLSQALRSQPRVAAGRAPAAPMTEEQRAGAAAAASHNAEDRAAYKALNEKHLEEAETRFKASLAKNADDPNALAGMGYIRMQQQNFGGALSFLVQAKQNGSKDPGLDAATNTSKFFYTLGEGAIALNENDLPLAEKQYRAALAMRPNSPEALEGLGGTLLKAQQPEAALPVFQAFLKVRPKESHAWRGVFIAQYGMGNSAAALATERQFPPAVRAQLMRDPLFLRSLSSAYSSVGRDADAQRVLKSALDLPFPADAKGVEAETQIQYAGLLQQANHLEQAAALYRQVLAHDQNNTDAWQGLVRVEHALSQDAQALQTLESMPPTSYAKAMRDTGFEQTVASIYQSQQRLDVAQDILEKALAQQTTSGQRASLAAEVQLAGIYLQRGDSQHAYPLYQQILSQNPDRVDSWKGLLSSLHDAGRDNEVLAEVKQIPAPTRAKLEDDPDFLQTVGAAYNALGQPQQAQLFLRRVQQHYAFQHTAAPAEIDVQEAWLLYNSKDDAGLLRQLLRLGGRTDLTFAQRQTVQVIWANFAVRRANQAVAQGDRPRALAILNATARSFSDNPVVIKILAAGYATDGQAKQAVLIWKSQDLKTASVTDYRAAVGAALAANDLKDAEAWLRFGLDQYPRDADLLILAAKFEEARGDNNRAADYYRVALRALPAPDPGAELATELGRPIPPPNTGSDRPAPDLAKLLAPMKESDMAPVRQVMGPGMSYPSAGPSQPYLPSDGATGTGAPIQMYSPGNSDTTVPSYMSNPAPTVPSNTSPRLRDYAPQPGPQSELRVPADAMHAVAAFTDEPTITMVPAVFHANHALLRQASYLQQSGAEQSVQAQGLKPGPLSAQPTAPAAPAASGQEVYGPYVPYHPPAATAAPTVVPPVESAPTARYVPNATSRPTSSSHPEVNAAAAAGARRRQSIPAATPRSGESKPPVEDYSTTPTETVQYNPAQAASQTVNQTGAQVTQPGAQKTQSLPMPAAGSGDSNGQQYPQPGTGSSQGSATGTRGRVRAKGHVASSTQAATPAAPAPQAQPAYTGLSYPGVGQGLTYQPYPIIGPSYPLGTPPSDADLMEKRLPPLRGGYITDSLPPALPLTPRQQTERDLAILEQSYSGWLGGTVSARYRSGTAGLDRLTDLEATFEASATVANNVRFTIVPRAVFLNSGTLDLTTYAGATTGVPVLGTLPLNAVNPPAQQSTSGVGGEFQIAGNRYAAAVGYTPYEFLVRNVTGRGLFKAGKNVTLYFNRDSVTETQLSYAGLRDPGSATAVFQGNIWGGVVATGGGIRYDQGDEHAGFYFTADGADLTGYHVLQNSKFEGSAGAYFLVHTFPGYGRLNIGASAFGMHYAHNERGESYGLGGYFSPDAYFLASVPVTFAGRYTNNFHYTVAGSLGVQTFQEDSQIYFPLDPTTQNKFASTANAGGPCLTAQIIAGTCASMPRNSNTGGNYSINAEGVYRIADHWFAGGFLSANNTNNYNTVTGGFFVRYLFRPQYATDDYPTGLFPVDGFRPLRVP